MKHSFVPIDRIFAKFSRDITNEFSEEDLVEWTGEALEAIGTCSLYEEHVAFVEVKDFQAPVPKWCHSIGQIARDNRWQGRKSSIFCPKKIVAAVTENTTDIPVALDCKGTPIHDYDLAYYRPYFDLGFAANILNNTSCYRQHYTPVRLKTHSFFGSSVAANGGDEYTVIQGQVLRFSFRSGFVAISYNRQGVDDTTGYPLVPDAISHTTAITKYLTMKTWEKNFYAGRQGAGEKLKKAEDDWQWYCGQSSNNDKMLSGIDEHQNFLDQRLQLLPQNKRYFGFFGNLAQPQDSMWGSGTRDVEGIDGLDLCETTEQDSCNSAPSIINVTNVTNYTNGGGGTGGGSGDTIKRLIGVVNGGGADDPVAGLRYFQNTKLIGLSQKMSILVDDIRMSSWGQNKSFNYFPINGRIEFIIPGYTWQAGSSLEVSLNQKDEITI